MPRKHHDDYARKRSAGIGIILGGGMGKMGGHHGEGGVRGVPSRQSDLLDFGVIAKPRPSAPVK
jgi:hypothetical protein